jgi:ATP-binding cassette subfamily B protein
MWPKVYMVMAFVFLANIIGVYYPYGIKNLVSVIEHHGLYRDVVFWAVVSFLCYSTDVASGLLPDYRFAKKGKEAKTQKLTDYLARISGKDLTNIQSIASWELLTRLNNCIEAEFTIVSSLIRRLPQFLVRFWFVLVILAIYFPIWLAFIPILFIAQWAVGTFTRKKSETLSKVIDSLNERRWRVTLKVVQEHSLVKINNSLDYEIDELKKIGGELTETEPLRNLYGDAERRVMWMLFVIFEVLWYLYLWPIYWKWSLSLAELLMIVSYVRWLRTPIDIIYENFTTIQRNINKYKTFHEFLNLHDTIKDGDKSFVPTIWDIALENIEFAYDSKQLFQNISLYFQGGKTTALVGHSGSGKSTLVKLIMRLWDSQKWRIMIDNQNLKDLKISTFYDHIAYLTQEPAVFDGTIRENILYGTASYKLQASSPIVEAWSLMSEAGSMDTLIWQALDRAELGTMVRELKDGLDTQIGDRGIKLSGWERQRLGIARVFLKNPQIIILDEPTSALDSQSEHQINRIMQTLFVWKTVIVIAHRLQTVMYADKIYVLGKAKNAEKAKEAKNGEVDRNPEISLEEQWGEQSYCVVMQEGTHQELMIQDWVYKKLLDLQKGTVSE